VCVCLRIHVQHFFENKYSIGIALWFTKIFSIEIALREKIIVNRVCRQNFYYIQGYLIPYMFQFIVGFTTGVYVAQTYDLPKLSVITTYLQDKLKEIEKQQKK
jgi:hypothetical protein